MDEITSVIDQPIDTSIDPGTPNDHQQIETPEEQEQPPQPEDRIDGRKFNPKWSSYLKEIKEQALASGDQTRADEISDMITKMRDNYARYQDIQGLGIKGVEDVRGMQALVNSLGGSEAAADMLQRVASQEAIDARIEAGDDSFLDELPENLQKGVYGMVPSLLSRLSSSNPQAFNDALAPHFSVALAGTGLGEVADNQIKSLQAIYARTDDPEIRAEIKSMFDDAVKVRNWYQQQTASAGKLTPGQKSVDPQVQRLESELASRRQADEDAFLKGITDATKAYVATSFKSNAEVYLKQFNLTEAQQADLMDSFSAKLTAKLATDTAFQKRLGAYKSLKNRNADTVNEYIQSKVDENAKSIIDSLVTARYGGARQRKATAPAASATAGGAIRVTTPPDPSEWDKPKMDALGYEATAKIGKFYLKGGRVVQVVRQ